MPGHPRFGLVRVRSPLLAQSLVYFLFLRVLRCFSSPGSPLHCRCRNRFRRVAPFGNPRIRDICSSPWLIAACHVLRRLREPRHPSCALVTFLYDLGDAMSICMASVLDPHRIRRYRTSVRSSGGVIAAMPSFLRTAFWNPPARSPLRVLLACVDSILDLDFSLCLFDLPAPRGFAPRRTAFQYVNVLSFVWRITDSNR